MKNENRSGFVYLFLVNLQIKSYSVSFAANVCFEDRKKSNRSQYIQAQKTEG